MFDPSITASSNSRDDGHAHDDDDACVMSDGHGSSYDAPSCCYSTDAELHGAAYFYHLLMYLST